MRRTALPPSAEKEKISGKTSRFLPIDFSKDPLYNKTEKPRAFRLFGGTGKRRRHLFVPAFAPSVTEKKDMKKVIEKWYRTLPFPKEYDEAFYAILERTSLTGIGRVEDYPATNCPWDDIATAERNLLAYLWFCEETERRYAEKGLPHEVFLASMNDIVRWSDKFYQATGKLGLGELSWTVLSQKLQLFELGRLQFNFTKLTTCPIPALGAEIGEPCIGAHIPAGGPLKIEEALASFRAADEFFAKYFPEYSYRFYTCYSWLLDPDLVPIIGEASNIARFAALFTPI